MRAFGQSLVASAVAYALLIQALALPVIQTRAKEMARIEIALGVICAGEGADSLSTDGPADTHRHNGIDCCLAACWTVHAGPAILAGAATESVARVAIASAFAVDVAGARAPPAALHSPLQPRAPPVPA